MTADQLLAISPIILTAAVSVVVMIAIAIRRDFQWIGYLTLGAIGVALLGLPMSAHLAPMQVTPLLRVDDYAVFFFALVLFAGLVVTIFSMGYFSVRPGEREELYVLLLTALLGAEVLVASSHFAAFFIGLEILSVSLYALVAYPIRDRRALEAGIKYLILSGVSSSLLLFGIAVIYAELGTLVFDQVGQGLQQGGLSPVVLVGTVLVAVGVGFKLSLVPFHLWTPDVYQGAPAPIAGFVATVSKAAVFALLLRYFLMARAYDYESLSVVFSFIAVLSMLGGNLLALLQTSVKRLLAYSSVAHMGYLLVPLVAASTLHQGQAIESVAFYLAAYVLTTLGAFGVVSVLSTREGDADHLDHYRGLFWRDPWMAGLFTAILLSLAGIPLTVGFVGKFYLFVAGAEASLWSLLLVLIVGSGIGIYYYLRIVLVMARAPTTAGNSPLPVAPRLSHLTLSLLTLLLIWLGVYPASLVDWIQALSGSLS